MSAVKFISRLAAFLLIPTAIFLYFEIRSGEVRNNYTAKRDYIKEHRDNIEVLTLGSSHGLLGINPEFIQTSTYNLAMDSQSLSMDLDLAREFIPQMKNLKLVIFPVSYFSLEYSLFDYNKDIAAKYSCFYGIEGDIPFLDRLSPQNYLRAFLYGPAQLKEFYHNNFVVDLAYGMTERGWFSKKPGGSDLISDASGQGSVSHHHKLMKSEYLPKIIKRVEQFLSWVPSSSPKIAFISTPVFETYRKAMNQERWNNDFGELEKVLKERGVNYYNFMADPSFNVGDFADNDHLSYPGAEKFSKLLSQTVISNELGAF